MHELQTPRPHKNTLLKFAGFTIFWLTAPSRAPLLMFHTASVTFAYPQPKLNSLNLWKLPRMLYFSEHLCKLLTYFVPPILTWFSRTMMPLALSLSRILWHAALVTLTSALQPSMTGYKTRQSAWTASIQQTTSLMWEPKLSVSHPSAHSAQSWCTSYHPTDSVSLDGSLSVSLITSTVTKPTNSIVSQYSLHISFSIFLDNEQPGTLPSLPAPTDSLSNAPKEALISNLQRKQNENKNQNSISNSNLKQPPISLKNRTPIQVLSPLFDHGGVSKYI